MPLSEFHRAATSGKLESSQNKMISSTSDVSSFMPGQEFVELLWENGGIVMEGQLSRPKKSLNSSSVQEKNGRDAPMEKFGLFSNELSPAVPCANIRLNAQDDDVDPWITNYPMEEPLCSEFFPEFAAINPYSPSTERNNSSAAKGFHYVEHNHSSKLSREDLEPSRFKADKLFRSWQQCQSSVTNTKSRLTGFGFGGGSSSTQQSQFQKQDLASSSKAHQGSNTCGLMNFCHFSRPVSLAKANIGSVDKSRSHQKASSTAATTDPTEPATLVESRSATKTIHELVPVEPPLQAICKKDLYRNNPQKNTAVADSNSRLPDDQINHQSSSFGASAAAQRQEAEKGPEAVVASSVCSGNSAGAASNDSKNRGKRKLREGEESGSYSEDLDDELIGVKKPTGGRGGTGTKRSRAAEVHNLSERRRRDRINERMRALQELIPNCNKVDKASMLDEAIEYLKTLQLQVQMMSMGSGLYMPPMMLQHVRPSPMAHFSPIGLGMGMGLGYGMPMLDMNGSQGCPLVPVPMHTSQLSCASISGTAGLHGMSGSAGLQLLGIPSHGQGLPISMPRPPLLNPLSCLTSMTNSMNRVASATANPLPISDIGPSSRCKDQQQQQQCINSNE